MSVQIIILGKPREISPQLAALQHTGIAQAGKPIKPDVQFSPLKRARKTEHGRPMTWHRHFTLYTQTIAAAWFASVLLSDCFTVGATLAQNLFIIAMRSAQ